MIEAAEAALQFSQGRQRADLDHDAMLRFALTRAVQIIGEAAARVSVASRAEAGAVQWTEIVAMRNRLVHANFDVDSDILWATVVQSLPSLLDQRRAVEGLGHSPDQAG